MNKLTPILLFVAVLIFYTSCKKNDTTRLTNTTYDSATIMGFKDSTQLIKSFISLYYDTTGAITDSTTTYFSYDTVNRKITFRSGAAVSSTIDAEFDYNSAGVLVHLAYLDPSPDSLSVASIDYAYDASNILKTATIKNNSGQTYTESLNKTLLSGGNYQLGWLDTDPAILPDSNYYVVNFDVNGRMLSYYDNTATISDSVVYDVAGNISKVEETLYNAPYDTSGAFSFQLYDFGNRDTKGNQLYNFFQIVYNGVANIPPDVADFGPDTDQDFLYQIFKYPALSTNINRPVGDEYCVGCAVKLVNFNNSPQYDSQSRLVRYSTFFNDTYVYRIDAVINYYK